MNIINVMCTKHLIGLKTTANRCPIIGFMSIAIVWNSPAGAGVNHVPMKLFLFANMIHKQFMKLSLCFIAYMNDISRCLV